jgi:vacuolar-type H+-ATPase subunit I/STV1
MLTEERSKQLSEAMIRLDSISANIMKQSLSAEDQKASLSQIDRIRKETEDAMKRLQAAAAREVAFKEHQKKFQEVQKQMQQEFAQFKTSSKTASPTSPTSPSNILKLLDQQEEVLATINNILVATRHASIAERVTAQVTAQVLRRID